MRPVIRHGKFCDARDQFTLPRPGLENCATFMAPHGSAVRRAVLFLANRSLPSGLAAAVAARGAPGAAAESDGFRSSLILPLSPRARATPRIQRRRPFIIRPDFTDGQHAPTLRGKVGRTRRLPPTCSR